MKEGENKKNSVIKKAGRIILGVAAVGGCVALGAKSKRAQKAVDAVGNLLKKKSTNNGGQFNPACRCNNNGKH